MTKEEAWLAWMKAAKTTDTPIETDFELIKKTSWWQAFEAGWNLASVNLNGWDQAYAMGLEAGKQEWDGPTDEEYENFCSLIQREEAKLKEKNT
jgi:hypothetical protein